MIEPLGYPKGLVWARRARASSGCRHWHQVRSLSDPVALFNQLAPTKRHAGCVGENGFLLAHTLLHPAHVQCCLAPSRSLAGRDPVIGLRPTDRNTSKRRGEYGWRARRCWCRRERRGGRKQQQQIPINLRAIPGKYPGLLRSPHRRASGSDHDNVRCASARRPRLPGQAPASVDRPAGRCRAVGDLSRRMRGQFSGVQPLLSLRWSARLHLYEFRRRPDLVVSAVKGAATFRSGSGRLRRHSPTLQALRKQCARRLLET